MSVTAAEHMAMLLRHTPKLEPNTRGISLCRARIRCGFHRMRELRLTM